MSDNNVKIVKSGEFHWVGDGFPVKSVFGYNNLGQELSPFLLMDYAAPYQFKPAEAKRGVGAHPHRGFETVTIAYQGEIEHRDSKGGGGKIGTGDVQWMTAAGGLLHEELHSEEFTKQGGTFEMIQLWVNLPAKDKNAEPSYQTLLDKDIPRINFEDNGTEIKIIAGEFKGIKGLAKTFTPINLWDISVRAGELVEIDLTEGHTKALFLRSGSVEVQDQNAETEDLIVFDKDLSKVSFKTKTDSNLLLMSGEPLNEPIVGHGPFVMNTKEEIQQAFQDYRMGKMGSLD